MIRSFVAQFLRLLDLFAKPVGLMLVEATCCLRRRLIWAVRSFVVLFLGMLVFVVWAVLAMVWVVEYVVQLVLIGELCSWMSPLTQVMFLVHGLSGLGLLRLHLLMLISSVVDGLVLGRGSASFRVVRLGGHKIHRARGNAADAHDAAAVFLCRDSSIAPLLDMRRMFQAVMDVLDAMIRYGVSLSRSLELTAQWDRILAAGPLYPVTLGDLSMVRGLGIGAFHHAVSNVHHRLSDFIRVAELDSGRPRGASLQVASSRFGSPSSISPV